MITKKYYKLVKVSYEDEQYFFMRNVSDQTGNFSVTLVQVGSGTDNNNPWSNVEYSTDGVNWVSYDLSTKPTVEIPSGRNIYLRGDGGATGHYSSSWTHSYYMIKMDTDHIIGGNILSLIDKTNFKTMTTYSQTYVFEKLFRNNTHLIDASNLNFGQISSVTQNCYNSMFYGCTSLTTAPELPATTIADSCYQYMFQGCTSLTTAPATLPATTLTDFCYDSMFYGCTSLTMAPELPATTLSQVCYQNMFKDCTSLNTVKCLAEDISASSCTQSWLNNVSATGTFYKSPNMSSWTTGNNGIPSGWTVVDA